ncbi:MAG TPA: hypothetical protein VKB71_08640 [Rhizomicrobium sp.]|nr:hypothetical protein [Rhizomicrobium sp.]
MSLEPEHPHHGGHKTGLSWLDLAIAVSALLISMTSLIVTIVHSRALERMADANAKLVQANSWPFVSYYTGHNQDGTVHVGLMNKGVGPAKIETIELKWKGVAYRNAFDFLAACCGYKPTQDYDTGSVDVLRAGQEGNLFAVSPTAANQAVRDRFDVARISPDMNLNICYCSVFDECWKADVVRLTLERQQVERCEPPAVSFGLPK